LVPERYGPIVLRGEVFAWPFLDRKNRHRDYHLAVSSDDDRWTNGPKLQRRHARPIQSDGPRHRCPLCRGAGVLPGITKTQGQGKGMGSEYGPCPECGGAGWVTDDESPLD
jgi:hypothetical protein